MTLFYFFGAVAVIASLLVIAQRNPIYSVLLLIASFGALSGLYVLLDAPFVAVIAEWDNFGERTVVKLRDFTDRDTINRCIAQAARVYAIQQRGGALHERDD